MSSYGPSNDQHGLFFRSGRKASGVMLNYHVSVSVHILIFVPDGFCVWRNLPACLTGRILLSKAFEMLLEAMLGNLGLIAGCNILLKKPNR